MREAQASVKLRVKGEALSGGQANTTHTAQWRAPHPLSYFRSSTGGINPQSSTSSALGVSTSRGHLAPGAEHPVLSRVSSDPLEPGSTPCPHGNELQLSDSSPESEKQIPPPPQSLGPNECPLTPNSAGAPGTPLHPACQNKVSP